MRAPGPLTEPVDSYGLTGRELDTLLAALRLWQLLRRAPPGACAIPPECLAIAANGRRFGKDEVLARLPQESGIAFTASGFQCRLIAPGVALLNYDASRIAHREETRSRRSSLWRHEAGVWRMCFHQGTPLA